MLRGMASALYAFAAFFVVAGAAPPRVSLLAAFALATARGLIAQGARATRQKWKTRPRGTGRVFASPRLITRPGTTRELLAAAQTQFAFSMTPHFHGEPGGLRDQHVAS